MKPLVLPLPGNEELAIRVAARLGADMGTIATRHFPDGETYVRLECDVASRRVFLVSTLDRPDDKILRLLFTADAVRDLGAARVGLFAPYLSYMRQDRRFQVGEALTSKTFARLLSPSFDWLVTVDPHLHRRSSMSELYAIPVAVCHASSLLSAWIGHNARNPIVIGPDAESAQWVSAVASEVGAPFTVLEKHRRGDRDVEIHVRDIARWRDRQPVLVDDIISSGRTMEATIKKVIAHGLLAPIIIGVHGIFAEDAYERLMAAGASQIVTTNSVPHATNAIDVSGLVVESISAAV